MVFTDLICKPLQKKVFQIAGTPLPINNTEPRQEAVDIIRADGIRYVSEISYESRYPNGYMDIYYCPEPGAHPTVLYWHGGGFIFGDKVHGDPLASKGEGEATYIMELCRRGYNVISANYALAPQYRCPVQIRQVNEAVEFCMKNAEKLGLDMDRVFICGGSAGAVMTEVYGMAVVDADYAANLGFTAALPESKLRGLIIDEAPTDYRNYNNRNMYIMMGTWVGTNNMKKCKKAELLDVPKCIKDKYPPCVIIASNLEHFFPDGAKQLKDRLDAIGGDYAYFYIPKEVEELEHGFMNRFATSKGAREALELTLDFMERHKETV